ncbi:MAG TPA: glycine oxidase ThiO [Candidatus Saccharimonadales bacterium]|nr:glycine oxidase ThiO [Candidatus Saccharimonadales bacterium]
MKKFDVAIAGAGVIGGAIALELARSGLRVALFDRQTPGQEASWASAGILSPAPETSGMIPLVAIGKASMALYPEFVKDLEGISGEKTGYRPKGTIQALFSRDARAELSTVIALHHGVGLKAEPLRTEEARKLEPGLSEEMEAAILRPDEASIDNRALTRTLLVAARNSGVETFPSSEVQGIWKEGNRCAGLIVGGEKIAADWTVIAAGCFSGLIGGVGKYAPVRPAKGQILALRGDGLNIERVLWSENIYLVPRNDGRIIAGATVEDVGFDKKLTAGATAKNLAGAIELVPGLGNAQVEESWAGLRPDTPDHLPILGPTDLDGLLIATGHFRSGIILTPITARLIREWITLQKVSVDWDRFSPLRFGDEKQKTAN